MQSLLLAQPRPLLAPAPPSLPASVPRVFLPPMLPLPGYPSLVLPDDDVRPRDHSPQHHAILVSNQPTHVRAMSPRYSGPRTDAEPSAHMPSSPSPPQARPPSSFPSAPHHLNHFASSETSSSPNIGRYAIANLSDRYLRASDKYSHNQLPLLDQRRMSEPAMYGSAACGYTSNSPDLSDARHHHLPFSYVPPQSYSLHPSSPPHRASTARLSDSSRKDPLLPLHHYDSVELEEPLSPLNPSFSGGASSPPLGMSGVLWSLNEDYGPSPPGTGTSTSSNPPPTHHHTTSTAGPSSPSNTKQYSFVALPGNGVKKRPRRRYDEIERLYQCSWQNCSKAYGTLNHLNAHITMQKHGPKRSPNEFKELRKQWRKAKKEEAEARAAHAVRRGSHHLQHPSQSHHSMSDAEYHTHDVRPSFDYPERSIQPIACLDALHDPHHRSQRYGPFVSPPLQHGGIVYPHPHGTSTSNVPVNRLPANSTLLTPLPGYEPSSIGGAPDFDAYNSYDLRRGDSRPRTGHGSPGRYNDRERSRSSQNWP